MQEARQARNWTPELAARETKIKVDRLLDLEADNYTHFSGPAYARGFVRTYARALGLDEYRILRQLDNKLPDDDTPNLVNDSGVAYLPEASLPLPVAHRNFTGLYVLLALSGGIFLIIAFVLLEAYRVGELPHYFNRDTTADTATTTTDTNSPTATEPNHQALPVDSNTPPPVVDNNDTSKSVKALPVDPAALTADTNAAPVGDVPEKSVRALPVDPSELTNAAPVPPVSPPPVAPAPALVSTDTNAPPRALPVDPSELAAVAPPAVTNAPPVAVPVPTPPPSPAPALSARQANSGPVLLPTLAPSTPNNLYPSMAATNSAPLAATDPDPSKILILTASQDSFVRVTALDTPNSDKPLYADTLRSGHSIGFDGHKFSINVGVPSAVDIKLDGVNYGPHSDHDAPETFTVESHQK